jgi:hypothetical protein
MPSITDQLASGEGRYRSALVIAGWGTIFADSLDLEDASRPDGRARIGGLDPETVKISATSDLVRADIVQEGSTIQIFEDYLERVSASLAAVPTARAWITTNVAASDTSIFVTSTDGFPANGVIHIGSEAVKYASKSANAFAGCTRGWWDTTALAHYTGDGTDRVAALVTDLPESFIGRRASLYMWGSSDSLNGDGTERWRGVVRDAPEYRAGVWSFSVEPIAWTLDQPVGGDYIDGVPIRGVYLPYSSAWDAILTRSTGASVTDTYDGTDSGRATLSGFQSTQDDFCTALTAEIDTVITSWTWDADSEITALPLGDDGYRLIYRVGATTPYWVHVVPQDPTNTLLSPVDRLTAGFNSWYAPADPDTTVTTMVAGSTYYLDVTAPVPRGALGERSGRLGYWRDESNPENRANRVYLGGVVTPTTDMIITVREGSDEDAPSNFSTVSVADTST